MLIHRQNMLKRVGGQQSDDSERLDDGSDTISSSYHSLPVFERRPAVGERWAGEPERARMAKAWMAPCKKQQDLGTGGVISSYASARRGPSG